MWGIIEEAVEQSRDAAKLGSINAAKSLFDFVAERTAELVQDEEERETLLMMSEEFGTYIGVPISRQSLRFAWMEQCCLGGEFSAQWT